MEAKPEKMEHDDLFKRFLGQPRFLRDFFLAFLPGVVAEADLNTLEYLDKEHPAATAKRRRRTGDLLVKARFRGRDAAFLIHVEHQAKADAHLLARLGEYACRDYRRYGIPVYPVALLSYKSPAKAAPTRLRWAFTGRGRPGVDIRCAKIQLNRLSAARYLQGENLAGVAMAACMKLAASKRVSLAAWSYLQTVRQNLTQEEQEAMIELVHAYLHLDDIEILQIRETCVKLGATKEEAKTMVEIKNPWKRLGEIEGEIKGKIKGKIEGERYLLKIFLARKYGPLSRKCERHANRLAEEGVLALSEAMHYLPEATDLERWLHEAQTNEAHYFTH